MSDQTTTNVHLLVLIHGMWGNPSHLASMHRIIQQSINESSNHPNGVGLHVILPETNRDESTYDGIDWGGERVATEVSDLPLAELTTHLSARVQIFQEIEKLEKEGKRVTRFSITGYSLGGLLARYVVGCVSSSHPVTECSCQNRCFTASSTSATSFPPSLPLISILWQRPTSVSSSTLPLFQNAVLSSGLDFSVEQESNFMVQINGPRLENPCYKSWQIQAGRFLFSPVQAN
jgi:Putative serine esterase (DUF676)